MTTMPDQPSLHLVDMRRSASVSFAPPDPVTLGTRGRAPTPAPIAVGPGRAATAEPNRVRAELRGGVTYPILPGKIQAPALRDETLARTRLLDWLDVKIHSRVVFVIADAGYGKTTLLADFSRRTRVRTIWYRIDEDDRDWVGLPRPSRLGRPGVRCGLRPADRGHSPIAGARRSDTGRCDRDVPG
jgi:hypothetical protein